MPDPIEDIVADVMAEDFPSASIQQLLMLPTLSLALAVEVGLRTGKLDKHVVHQITARLRDIDMLLGRDGSLAIGEILAHALAASDDDNELAGPATCPRCDGAGDYARMPGNSRPCAVCGGTGRITDEGKGR